MGKNLPSNMQIKKERKKKKKNPPSKAWDVGPIPGWGSRIPYAVGQLSPPATTREKPGHQ